MIGDTIAAVATPIGEGGIGIVRVSGPDAKDIVKRIFKPRYSGNMDTWSSHSLHLGMVVHSDDGRTIDEVLVAWMAGPKTYTTEDVAEFHCHGGSVPVREVLEAVLRAGARSAEPGEFARRAFLGGRLDLAQAEAIMEVIRAKTSDSLGAAVSQLEGHLSKRIRSLRADLLQVIAHLEALIDFPEEDLPDINQQTLMMQVQSIHNIIKQLLSSAKTGRVLREGWRTVIVGRPNVGKSSLLNALLEEQRAIVTDIPGTTRDAIEEFIELGGIPLKLVDTAGIRETADIIEKIGVKKTREYMEKADLVIYVLDGSDEISPEDEELIKSLHDRSAIILVNKADVLQRKIDERKLREIAKEKTVISISAKEGWGLDSIAKEIRRLVYGDGVDQNKAHSRIVVDHDRVELVTQARHREALERAHEHVANVLQSLSAGMSPDFLTIDLKSAWEALGEITGETVGEDILDQIFSSFCIGK